MSYSPLFSVVIPTYRRPDLLARCLEPLAPGRQTFDAARFEVIVTDDSPSNETMEALIRERYPWARWTAGPRRGPAANRNHGARQASGLWLAFTDDDCIPAPEWLERYAERVEGENCPRVLEGRTTDGGLPIGPFMGSPTNESGGFLWSCNVAIVRELFFSLGGFDDHFPAAHLEDVDFRMRLQDGGHRFDFVPGAVVVHPPRPVHPIAKQARDMEAFFYLARKRKTSLAAIGLSAESLVRSRLLGFKECRRVSEVLRLMGRNLVEAVLLGARMPLWAWRYRRGP